MSKVHSSQEFQILIGISDLDFAQCGFTWFVQYMAWSLRSESCTGKYISIENVDIDFMSKMIFHKFL